jgi:ankyrin repeat protein
MLLNRGAEVDARSEGTGKTALMLAVNRGRGLDMATLLIDNCADVNTRSRDGHSPLMIAAWGPQLKMVKLLIEKGAEINARGGLLPQNSFPLTALMKTRAGQPVSDADIVEIREANHRKGWQHGRMTPLMYAARFSGNPEIIEYLLESGADPLVENTHGEKAIDLARQNKALENTPALKKLAEMSVE